MNTRFATTDDAEVVTSWILEDPKLMEHLPVISEKEAIDFSKVLVDFGSKKNAWIYLVEDAPCAIGTLFTTDYIKLKHHAQLTMFVKKEARKAGIGSALLEEILKKAKDQKVEQIDLELYDNPWAEFFEKRGFERYASQERFIKIENSYFARTLYRRYV